MNIYTTICNFSIYIYALYIVFIIYALYRYTTRLHYFFIKFKTSIVSIPTYIVLCFLPILYIVIDYKYSFSKNSDNKEGKNASSEYQYTLHSQEYRDLEEEMRQIKIDVLDTIDLNSSERTYVQSKLAGLEASLNTMWVDIKELKIILEHIKWHTRLTREYNYTSSCLLSLLQTAYQHKKCLLSRDESILVNNLLTLEHALTHSETFDEVEEVTQHIFSIKTKLDNLYHEQNKVRRQFSKINEKLQKQQRELSSLEQIAHRLLCIESELQCDPPPSSPSKSLEIIARESPSVLKPVEPYIVSSSHQHVFHPPLSQASTDVDSDSSDSDWDVESTGTGPIAINTPEELAEDVAIAEEDITIMEGMGIPVSPVDASDQAEEVQMQELLGEDQYDDMPPLEESDEETWSHSYVSPTATTVVDSESEHGVESDDDTGMQQHSPHNVGIVSTEVGATSASIVTEEETESEEEKEGSVMGSLLCSEKIQDSQGEEEEEEDNDDDDDDGKPQTKRRRIEEPFSPGSPSDSPGPSSHGATALFSGHTIGSQIGSLHGLQSVLSSTVEHVSSTLRSLVIKTNFCPSESMKTNSRSFGSFRKGTGRIPRWNDSFSLVEPFVRLQATHTIPFVRIPCRVFSSMNGHKKNLECKTALSTLGCILQPFSYLSMGVSYEQTKYGSKESRKRVALDSFGSAKAQYTRDSVSAIMALNPDHSGFTGYIAGCYGWGYTKTIRYVTHNEQTLSCKGKPKVAQSGGLIQLGYNIPFSTHTIFTPYIERIIATVHYQRYNEFPSLFSCTHSSTKEQLRERSIGLRHRWKMTPNTQLQTWIAHTVRRSHNKTLTSQFLTTTMGKYTHVIPGLKHTATQCEVGLSYEGLITPTFTFDVNGTLRMMKNKNVGDATASILLKYMY